MAEQWLSIVEYARATGISDMTIRRRIRTGRIRAELREGKYYIPMGMETPGYESSRPHSSHYTSSQHPVKNHPHAERPIERSMPTVQRFDPAKSTFSVPVPPMQVSGVIPKEINAPMTRPQAPIWKEIPNNVAAPLIDAGLASVEARALIEFCDRALDQARSTISAMEGKFNARIETLNGQIQTKEMELKSLNQQIEDLQLLVQILERKKT